MFGKLIAEDGKLFAEELNNENTGMSTRKICDCFRTLRNFSLRARLDPSGRISVNLPLEPEGIL